MAKLLFLALAAAAFLAVSSAQSNQKALHCYFCESVSEEYPECETHPEKSLRVDCTEMQYTRTRRSTNHTSPTQTDFLNKIFQSGTKRTFSSPPEEQNYKCISLDMQQTAGRNYMRSCVPVDKTIKSACDFIKNEAPKNEKIYNCNECDTDYCNTGFSLSSNLALHLVCAFFMWLLVKA